MQRRLARLNCGVYVAADAPEPVFGDGAGFRLITHDTSTGQFPDIAWLTESFPNATTVMRSNNRNVQARMCREGVGIAVLPRAVGGQVPGLRRLVVLGAGATQRHLEYFTAGEIIVAAASCVLARFLRDRADRLSMPS